MKYDDMLAQWKFTRRKQELKKVYIFLLGSVRDNVRVSNVDRSRDWH